MTVALEGSVQRFGEHRNAFGFLRLLFASLVIIAHTPELADGDRHREILTNLFGTISFGTLAVDGFFIISGYLIVGSFLKQPHAVPYLIKRVARIYPGFIVASLLSVFVVGWLGGAPWAGLQDDALRTILRIITLQMPLAFGAFTGMPYPEPNGSLWTIAPEFRCYLLVIVLGWLRLFRFPELIAALAVVMLAISEAIPLPMWVAWNMRHPASFVVIGQYNETLRLTAIFLVGSYYYLRRDRIRFGLPAAAVAAFGLIACLFVEKLAEPGLALFGSYLIFAVAGWAKTGILSRINNRDDISYGVYLYGWPVALLLLWFWPAIPIQIVTLATFLIACVCGWASWHGVEKPLLRVATAFARRFRATSTAH